MLYQTVIKIQSIPEKAALERNIFASPIRDYDFLIC